MFINSKKGKDLFWVSTRFYFYARKIKYIFFFGNVKGLNTECKYKRARLRGCAIQTKYWRKIIDVNVYKPASDSFMCSMWNSLFSLLRKILLVMATCWPFFNHMIFGLGFPDAVQCRTTFDPAVKVSLLGARVIFGTASAEHLKKLINITDIIYIIANT